MKKAIGLDFGTTNSTIAVAGSEDDVRITQYAFDGGITDTFRSILYFFHPHDPDVNHRKAVAGPEAISSYLVAHPKGRLLQSLKSFLASTTFTHTDIYRSRYSLEDLITIIIRQLKARAESQFGELGNSVVVGRPARFSQAKDEAANQYALNRLRKALSGAGFEQVHFEFEPVAAAYSYEQQLRHEELVLIADFGGGTSDFSLLHLGSQTKNSDQSDRKILGTSGVAIGGNDFDSAIVRHVVSPRLGLGSKYQSNGKLLPNPLSVYKQFERWHFLSFLKNQKTIKMLEAIKANALEPDQIGNLIYIIENDLGFQLYRAIERTKIELTSQEKSAFVFRDLPSNIVCDVTRQEFETWIDHYLIDINNCVDHLLINCNIAPDMVDSVFLTGGSAFVPAVRNLFANKFGQSRLRGGKELTSIGEGLSLRALALSNS